MLHKTPFGLLQSPPRARKERIDAVLRALRWCETILAGSLWTHNSTGHKISLQRTINKQSIEIFPLEAACLDLGMQSRFPASHLPIYLNNSNACVRSTRHRPRPLHTDMIASVMLLLGSDDFDPYQVPATLRPILTVKQLAVLPPRPFPNMYAPAPALDAHPLTLTDEEAREYILTTPENQWRHHAGRLSAELQPNTLCWLLLQLIGDQPSTAASTWAVEQMYVQRDLFSEPDIALALSHPNMSVRSWAVMSLSSGCEKNQLELLKPMRYDENPLVTHKVLTRIRGFTFPNEEKIELMVPLLDSDLHRGVAIIHIGHLILKPARKLEILAPFLASTNPEDVVSAIRGLRDSGCEKTEQALIECLEHENRLVIKCLLQSIASFGPWFESYAQKWTTQPILFPDLLKAMKRTRGFNQVPTIKTIMKHERNTIIVRGIAVLSKIHSTEAIEVVGGYLLNHDSRYVRRNAAEYLGETGRSAALTFLCQVDNDISIGVRNSAKCAIAKINKASC